MRRTIMALGAVGIVGTATVIGTQAPALSQLTDGSPSAGSSTPSAGPTSSATPAGNGTARTPRPSATPHPSATAPTATGLAYASLVTRPVTRVPVQDPDTMVAPGCVRPPGVFVNVPMTPAGAVKPTRYPAAQQLKAGTNHSVQASAWAYPAAQVQGWLQHPETQPTGRKIAFLTFDDGPNGATTPRVQAVLREEHVPATFFTVGREVTPVDAQLVRQSVADGNAIAIHSYGHQYHYLYPHGSASPANVMCDVAWAKASLTAVLGKGYRTQAMRYPGGHLSWKGMAPADAALAKQGYRWIDWNAMSGDADATMPNGTARLQAANIHRYVTKGKHPRRDVMVVLQHDYYPNPGAVEALRLIIRDLKKQGYSFGIID